MPARPREVLTPMPERLAAAAVAVAEAADALRLARQLRDELVVQAVDEEGISQRSVAAAAGITGARVAAILAHPGDDDDR
jgi:predicted XRE-type DNA-binding protein